jgi:quinol monooxygenase YgiN
MAFVLVARWTAKRGEDDRVRDCLGRLAEASRQEPGCRFYQPCQDTADPHQFLVFELYDDEATCDAHRETDHFREIAAGEAFPLLESRERAFFETL